LNGDASKDAVTTAQSHVFDRDMVYYQPTQGTLGLRKIMARYLQSLLMDIITQRQFNADNLVLGAGCNAVLENLCMCLSDPGDAVLIPTPYCKPLLPACMHCSH
jgi:aspartate/methionine/tyrosine aminotransferase